MSVKMSQHTVETLDAMFDGRGSIISVGHRLGTTIQKIANETDGNTEKAHTHPVTKLFHVDGNRSDSYVEDGSIHKPFKTISSAALVASSGSTISVMSGVYTEDVVVPAGVSLTSNGLNQVTISGDATFEGPASSQSLRGFIFSGTSKTLTINCTMNIFECFSYSKVVFGPLAHISSSVFNVNVTEVDVDAITFDGVGDLNMNGASVRARGTGKGIVINSGRLAFFGGEIQAETSHAIYSGGGTLVLVSSQVVNQSGGASVDLSNSLTTPTNLNALAGVIAVGGIDCGAADTIQEGVQFLVVGALSGTGIITNRIEKNGINGTFTTVDGKTITVVDGQITAIV